MTDQENFMRRCIFLAQKAEGQTYPNPMVGCVIVHRGKIIGEGYHKKAGEPHAEINAINSVKNPEILPFCDIYVSLEPCSHYGKTPPCAVKLKEIGFKKVVIGSFDSNEKVNGGGIKILQGAGITVEKGILEKDCRELNKRFFTFHEKKRPYLILKWAESADGFMDRDFRPAQIGNPLTKQFVHHLRTTEHAILVGTKTAMNDNPALTSREIFGRNPVRVVIDFDLKIPKNFNIYNDEAETIIINEKIEKTEGNTRLIRVGQDHFPENILKVLHSQEIQSVLVEGGGETLKQFIANDFWDEAIIIKNQNLYCKNGTPSPKLPVTPKRIEDFRGNMVEFYENKNSRSLDFH